MVEFGENGAVLQPAGAKSNAAQSRAEKYRYPDGPRPLKNLYRGFRACMMVFIGTHVFYTGFMLLFISSADQHFLVAFGGVALVDLAPAFAPISVVHTMVFLSCVVMSCRLTYRAMRNVWTVNSQDLTISPNFSVFSYFIPFVNLVAPVRAMDEIYTNSHAAAGETRASHTALSWWWVFWLLGSFVDRIVPMIEDLETAMLIFLLSGGLTLLAALLFLRIWSRILTLQKDFQTGAVSSVFS